MPTLLAKWQPLLGVSAERWFVQRMKTRWGSCNHQARTIRLNTELAKKRAECLEYIVVHELVHLLEPTHNARFIALMDRFMPKWHFHREDSIVCPYAKRSGAIDEEPAAGCPGIGVGTSRAPLLPLPIPGVNGAGPPPFTGHHFLTSEVETTRRRRGEGSLFLALMHLNLYNSDSGLLMTPRSAR